MEKISSTNRLSFFRSECVQDHKRLVVYPGYLDKIFGYFIGWESEETIEELLVWIYEPIKFFRKENEQTAQKSVDWVLEFISTNPSV